MASMLLFASKGHDGDEYAFLALPSESGTVEADADDPWNIPPEPPAERLC